MSPLLSEDPWSSGYSAMLGNSPHIGQPGSFSAINPQDRMVGRSANSIHILFIDFCFVTQNTFNIEEFKLFFQLKAKLSQKYCLLINIAS